ncbi:restriction endonuclease subunit S [Streptomyces sp. CA2R106]|uniref:restriction endonuclease subunit S n=1 Tax=Streptomyces sp. CA2R106 TaxID=3120153 RepID=UPI0030080732
MIPATSQLPYGASPPSSWKVVPLKYLAVLSNGFAFKSESRQGTGTPIIRIENLNGSDTFNHSSLALDDRYKVTAGDLLFSWSGNPGTSFGPFRWVKGGSYYLNQHIFNVSVHGCDKSWLYWSLRAATHWIERELTSGMIGMVHVTKAELANVPIPIPPIEEQRRIADFLDAETARIDALIDKREEMSELVAQRNQAVIRDQLRGGGKREPSDNATVPWIPGVPQHWDTAPLRYVSRIQRGASPRPIDDPVYFDDKGSHAWVRISDVTASEKYLTETTQRLSSRGRSLSVSLKPGELFVSIAASVGKPIITRIPCCIHDGFVAIRCPVVDVEFLYYLLLLGDAFKGLGKIGTQLNLNSETVGSIKIPIPPKDEQKRIVSVLNEDRRASQRLKLDLKRQINLLSERRQALITAAVTGQIDVSTASGRGIGE